MARRGFVFGGEVADHYEAWYESAGGRRADSLEKAALLELLGYFPGARSVLEVGCGTGHFTRWLNAQGFAAFGLELAPDMLAEARSRGGALLLRGDAGALPFADRSFDLTALVTTLEFLERPQLALTEALRVSRQGLLLGVLNRWSALGVSRRLAGFRRQTLYATAHFYGVAELRRVLRAAAPHNGRVLWRTTLFPRWWPFASTAQPWGGFIAMALWVA